VIRFRASLAARVAFVFVVGLWLFAAASAQAQSSGAASIPELTKPVNDFAGVIDAASAQRIERTIQALQAASGDVIIVATVPTIRPYGDIHEYAVQMFANHGKGIGDRGKDNGLLILLAMEERSVRVEVGYGLEGFITDGFSGQVSRDLMRPAFRQGNYGDGLVQGTNAVATRIAEGRNVQLTDVPRVALRRARQPNGIPLWLIVVMVIILIIISRSSNGPRSGARRWGRTGWSGWSSGMGPFGGGFGGGGFGGGGSGGFGGGFGGFGGGRSGGGGGGSSW